MTREAPKGLDQENAMQEEALINEATPVRNLLCCRDGLLTSGALSEQHTASCSQSRQHPLRWGIFLFCCRFHAGREAWRNSLSSSLLSFSVEVITSLFLDQLETQCTTYFTQTKCFTGRENTF